jgi:hypothetical protein
VKGRVPATFRVPGAVRGGHGAPECEVTSTTITGVDLRHIDSIKPMVEVLDLHGVGAGPCQDDRHLIAACAAGLTASDFLL